MLVASIMSLSWVVIVVVALWCGRGLVLCFVVMSDQLSHGQLPLSRVAWSSIVVVVFWSLVCYQFDDNEQQHWLSFVVQLPSRHRQRGT